MKKVRTFDTKKSAENPVITMFPALFTVKLEIILYTQSNKISYVDLLKPSIFENLE